MFTKPDLLRQACDASYFIGQNKEVHTNCMWQRREEGGGGGNDDDDVVVHRRQRDLVFNLTVIS